MMPQFRAVPDTHPHEPPRGLCRPSCCKTPYFCARHHACACHQGAAVANRTPAIAILALDRRDAIRGRACVLSAVQSDRVVPQHRQGGMGGRANKHRLPNLLWIDSILNGLIETDAEWAKLALAWGVKVPIWVHDVAQVPVYFANEHRWYALHGEQRRELAAGAALDMMLNVYGDLYLGWKAAADDTDRARVLFARAAS